MQGVCTQVHSSLHPFLKGTFYLLRYVLTAAWVKFYSQTALDHPRAEHPRMNYYDRPVKAEDMGTRLRIHPPSHFPLM